MAFVQQIYKIFVEEDTAPASWRKSLRNKTAVDRGLSDQELFTALPLGDCWDDASMASVYFYIRKGRHLVIPDSWVAAVEAFDEQLSESVS